MSNGDLYDIERDMWGEPPDEESMEDVHVAVLVLNRNMREMTENLIATIRNTCTPRLTIFSLDAASDVEQVVFKGADCVIRFCENRRWAWSFARGMEVALGHSVPGEESYRGPGLGAVGETSDGVEFDVDWNVPGADYTHFWLLCNDTQLDPSKDTLGILLDCMRPDACQIHPFQTTHPVDSPQGRSSRPDTRRDGSGAAIHNVAFVEFVCPLITRSFYDQCIANFGCPPVGPHFPYGWGVDYEMAYFGHQLKLKSYICDSVGITHHPGTTHLHHKETKVEDNNQMRVLARNTMLDVLEQRYGRNWGEIFANSARAAGVDPQAFLDWSSHDRALALRGARA